MVLVYGGALVVFELDIPEGQPVKAVCEQASDTNVSLRVYGQDNEFFYAIVADRDDSAFRTYLECKVTYPDEESATKAGKTAAVVLSDFMGGFLPPTHKELVH